jgi:hypothetical protein
MMFFTEALQSCMTAIKVDLTTTEVYMNRMNLKRDKKYKLGTFCPYFH